MFWIKIVATAVAVLSLAVSGTSGATAAPRHNGYHDDYNDRVGVISYRISNQERRIGRGQRVGRLDWVDAYRLRFELSQVRGFKQKYLRDGRLNGREVRHLDRLLDKNSRRIRHMARKSWGVWRPWRKYRQDRAARTFSQYNGFRY